MEPTRNYPSDTPELDASTVALRRGVMAPALSSSILDGIDAQPATQMMPPQFGVPSGPQPHDVIGAYRIVREVGIGGMGVVYEAIDQRLKRRAAIKMIRGGVGVSKDAVRRFQTEAEAVAQTQHPNIVQIYDVGWHEGQPFVALEYLPGGSLYARIGSKPQPPADAAHLIRILAEAMHHAHTHGVIHRDLKPANILFAADGTPKVTDFGAARLTQEGPDSNAPGLALTQVGEIIGTPQYMAPEQARGLPGAANAAIDVYALGALLYHMLTGRPPHDGSDAYDVINSVVQNDPVAPRRLVPKVPRDLEIICLKALEKHPANRYESAKAMGEDLARFQNGESILARPDPSLIRLWRKARRKPLTAGLATGLVLVALIGFLGVLWQWQNAIAARRSSDLEAHRAMESESTANAALEDAKVAGEAARQSAELAGQETAKAREAGEAAKASALLANKEAARALKESKLKDTSLHRSGVSEIALLLESGDFDQGRLKLEKTGKIGDGRPDLRNWEWHYLRRLGNNHLWSSSINTIEDVFHWTHAIAVSPDAKVVAYSCGNPYLDPGFDAYVPASLAFLTTDTGFGTLAWKNYMPESASQLVWRDANTIVAAMPHEGFRVFNYPDARVLFEGQRCKLIPRNQEMARAHISPDGNFVYRCIGPKEVELYDTRQCKPIRTIVLPSAITSLPRVVHSGTRWYIVVTTENGTHVIDPQTGQDVQVLPIPLSRDAAIDARGERIAIYNEKTRDGKAALEEWNLTTGRQEWAVPRAEIAGLCRLEFSPDGDKIAELFNFGVCLRLHDVASGLLDYELRGHTNRILDFRFSPDGRHIATASNDASVRVWSIADGADVMKFRGHTTGVRALAFDPNGWRLYSGGMDGSGLAWDLTRERTDGTRLPLFGMMGASHGGAFAGGLWCSQDGLGRYLDTSYSKLMVFDPATYTPVKVVTMQNLHPRAEKLATDFALSADGRLLFGPANHDGNPSPYLWDTTTGAVVRRFETGKGRVVAAALSADGSLAAAFIITILSKTDFQRELHVWHTATGEHHFHNTYAEFSYTALAFDTKGRLFCGLASNQSNAWGLHAMDLKTKTFASISYKRPTSLRHIAISPDNRWIATIDFRTDPNGQKVDVRNLDGASPGWTQNHVGPVTGLAFSPDSKRLASVRFDDSLKIYDVEAGTEAFYRQIPSFRFGDYAYPARVAFSPDGRSLMMNHSSAQLSVWNADDPTHSTEEGFADHRREAEGAAYAFHIRALKDLSNKPNCVGTRIHQARLEAMTPPNAWLAKEWEQLRR